jgi:hypothetical protein
LKTKNTITPLLIAFLLASCAPTVTPSPTGTALPPATATSAPTETPTPAPENLSDAHDLPVWVDDFVHAYGGKVTINGIEMDGGQLTEEIRKNGAAFIRVKNVNSTDISFLVVNDIPLAMREGNGVWQEATMARLGDMEGLVFESSLRLDDSKYDEFAGISAKVLGKRSVIVLTTDLDVTSVFGDFSESDWQAILTNWEVVQHDFSSGMVPAGYPYNWERGQQAMSASVKNAWGGDPQYRSQQLYGTLRTEGERIQALKQFAKGKSPEEMLKVFEFIVRTRVLEFPEIKRWDVSDEVSAAYVQYLDNQNIDVIFWSLATGLKPAELTLLVAAWVKKDNPLAETFITEANIFDTANHVAASELNYFYNAYIPQILQGNADHIVDGVIGENNWWIYEPQDWLKISTLVDSLTSKGLAIGGAETMIVSGDTPINDCCGRHKLVQIEDPELAQADMYAKWVSLYLDKGIKTIGFGNIDDFYAWTQDVNLPDANPTLFDSNFRAKPAYYAIVQVLYEHLP